MTNPVNDRYLSHGTLVMMWWQEISSDHVVEYRFGHLGFHFGRLGLHFGRLGFQFGSSCRYRFGRLGFHFGRLGFHFGRLGFQFGSHCRYRFGRLGFQFGSRCRYRFGRLGFHFGRRGSWTRGPRDNGQVRPAPQPPLLRTASTHSRERHPRGCRCARDRHCSLETQMHRRHQKH